MKKYTDFAVAARPGKPFTILQISDMQVIDAAQRRYPERLSAVEIEKWETNRVEENCYRHIRSLVEENYKVRLANRNAELKALQAQINPHFLYNTLDTIKWLILDGKTEASIATVNELSKYFRKSLNKGRDIVPLQDEYELVRSYMTIQKQRFHDDFQVIWDVDPSVLHTQLPKLTLQPIVENALLHGAQTKKDGKGCIWITIARKNKNVVIQIRDNGEGMTAEEARQAIQRDVEAKGYGISNVYQRLQLYGGDLQIQSDRHAGTSVLIIIPVKE